MELTNKKCIITGSAQGLGKAFANILLDLGAQVCISDVNVDAGNIALTEFKKTYGEKNVCFVKCDVTNVKEFENLFDEAETYFGVDSVDMLVNNAGINTNSGWKKCMDVNIIAVMIGCEIALRRMEANSIKGTIINIASMAGLMTGYGAYMAGYTVSKWGVVGLTRTLAWGSIHHGINIKALCPAWADTQLMNLSDELPAYVHESVQKSVNASGGLMSPDYVAEGFTKLVTACENGSVLMVIKDTPFTIVPDTALFKLGGMVMTSKLIGKFFRLDLVTVWHEKMFAAAIFFLLIFIVIAIIISVLSVSC